jgi:hypothetical protein
VFVRVAGRLLRVPHKTLPVVKEMDVHRTLCIYIVYL